MTDTATTPAAEKADHIHELDTLACRYGKARERLADLHVDCERELGQVKARFRSPIKGALAKCIELRDLLLAKISERKELFSKPKSRTMHGIKLGLRKKKGKIVWPKGSDAKVVERIRKHFPEKADLLIKSVEAPSKDALQSMTAADLKKLGVSVVSDTDEIFVKDAANDLDKLIEQLLDGKDETQ